MGLSLGQPDDLSGQLRSARSKGGAYQVPPRVVVRLSGRDAFRYLNGQVTRDLSRLSSGEAISACLLTPKGRLCAPVLISRAPDNGEDLLLEADPLLEESLMARLDRYIVADDVTLSIEPSLPNERSAIHFFGSSASAELLGESSAMCVSRLGVPGWDLESVQICEDILSPLLDSRVVETLRIERAIPAWDREMTVETLPPEVGLDSTHIDYDRGCYPGQEVISRLKSIGRVNRLLHVLRASCGALLRAGMPLLAGAGKEIGAISSASEQFDTGSWVALAVLPRETAGTLFAFDPLTGDKTPLSIVKITGS